MRHVQVWDVRSSLASKYILLRRVRMNMRNSLSTKISIRVLVCNLPPIEVYTQDAE